jgi:Na+/melibiose symporter-like transporter
VAYFASGFVAAGFGALIRAMVADVADDIRLTQGKERGGLLYSLIASTNKIAVAASVIITYPLLERIGYDPKLGHANSAAAIEGLTVAFLAGPIGFLALGAICMLGYRLTAERAAETRRQLDERDAELAAETAAGA